MTSSTSSLAGSLCSCCRSAIRVVGSSVGRSSWPGPRRPLLRAWSKVPMGQRVEGSKSFMAGPSIDAPGGPADLGRSDLPEGQLECLSAAAAVTLGKCGRPPGDNHADDRPPRRRHLRAVPPLLRPAPLHQGQGPAVRRGGRRAAHGAADDRAGRDAPRRRDRSRHRVVPQRAVAGLQDRRGHRAGALARSSIRSRRRWRAMGVVVWPMVELEADDALASAAHLAAADDARSRRSASGRPTRTSRSACAATAWCRSTARGKAIRDAAGVRAKFGVEPELIPDYLALVGDAADGYPGHRRHRRRSARRGCSNRHGPIEAFPPRCSASGRSSRCCSSGSRRCAPTRRCSHDVDELRWRGPTAAFAAWAERAADARLLERSRAAAGKG